MNKKGAERPQVLILLEYKYSKAAACLWLVLAVFLSVILGIAFGLARKDLGIGIESGTGILAFLTATHKIISSAVSRDALLHPGVKELLPIVRDEVPQ
jgi:hypothetical protein